MSVEQYYFLITGFFIALFVFHIPKATRVLKAFLVLYRNNKSYNNKLRSKKAMLNRGEMHEWIKIYMGTKEIMVCKKTGWCPSLNGFLDINYVNSMGELQLVKAGFEKYKEQRIAEMARDLGISVEEAKNFSEEIFKMKKEYYLNNMSNQLKRMYKKANDEQ